MAVSKISYLSFNTKLEVFYFCTTEMNFFEMRMKQENEVNNWRMSIKSELEEKEKKKISQKIVEMDNISGSKCNQRENKRNGSNAVEDS